HAEPRRLEHRSLLHINAKSSNPKARCAKPAHRARLNGEIMTAITPATRPEDERLGIGASITYGLQHVLTMYGGIIAVPLIIGQAAGLDPTAIGLLVASGLFIGGLATVLQSLGVPFFGSQLPLVHGVSFAGFSTMRASMNPGDLEGTSSDPNRLAAFAAVIAATLLGLLTAPSLAMIGKFFPRVGTGVVLTMTGLSLMR